MGEGCGLVMDVSGLVNRAPTESQYLTHLG